MSEEQRDTTHKDFCKRLKCDLHRCKGHCDPVASCHGNCQKESPECECGKPTCDGKICPASMGHEMHYCHGRCKTTDTIEERVCEWIERQHGTAGWQMKLVNLVLKEISLAKEEWFGKDTTNTEEIKFTTGYLWKKYGIEGMYGCDLVNEIDKEIANAKSRQHKRDVSAVINSLSNAWPDDFYSVEGLEKIEQPIRSALELTKPNTEPSEKP